MNDNSPFKFINNINNKDNLKEEDLTNFNFFLLLKSYYYGNNNEKECFILNRLYNLPKEMQYKLSVFMLSDKKTNWIKKKGK